MRASLIKSLKPILLQKCPNCGKGNIFYQPKRFVFRIPEMYEKCTECSYYFEREPGYFLGAMYLSYGLGVMEGILAFVLTTLLFSNLQPLALVGVVALTILVFAFWNFKLSRVIWLYIFPQ